MNTSSGLFEVRFSTESTTGAPRGRYTFHLVAKGSREAIEEGNRRICGYYGEKNSEVFCIYLKRLADGCSL